MNRMGCNRLHFAAPSDPVVQPFKPIEKPWSKYGNGFEAVPKNLDRPEGYPASSLTQSILGNRFVLSITGKSQMETPDLRVVSLKLRVTA